MDKKPRVSAIAAIGKRSRVLGEGNKLVWKIAPDMKRLKALTTGHPLIMGRKTFESIGRPLPGRTNIVVTRNPEYQKDGIVIASSIGEALKIASEVDSREIFIFGGAEIYAQSLPYTNRLYLTLVDADAIGDAYFPPYEEFSKVIEEENHPEHEPPFSWVTLERP